MDKRVQGFTNLPGALTTSSGAMLEETRIGMICMARLPAPRRTACLAWIVATIVFLALHLVPGDPAELLLSTGGVSPGPRDGRRAARAPRPRPAAR